MTVKLPIADQAQTVCATEDESKQYRVGDLAQVTNKTVRALHLYEELGLLRPSERSKGNYRMYGADAVTRVQWISKLQELGFSLPEIREVLSQWEKSGSAPNAMQRLRELYEERLEQTRKQIAHLQSLERELVASVGYLSACTTCEPVRLINACPKCEQHTCEAPVLVAGLHSQMH